MSSLQVPEAQYVAIVSHNYLTIKTRHSISCDGVYEPAHLKSLLVQYVTQDSVTTNGDPYSQKIGETK